MAGQILSDADHARITAAVSEAESHSAGEIVTIITERSANYAETPLAWAAVAAFLTLGGVALYPAWFRGWVDVLAGGWNHDFAAGELLGALALFVLIKFLAVYLILQWMPLRGWFTPGRIKRERVQHRAIAYFKVGAERRTTGRTGVLIYLSMLEHRAEIVADQAINSKISGEEWGAAMAALIAHVKDGRVADGMVEAIHQVGAVLRRHFPRDSLDQNELPDRLIEV